VFSGAESPLRATLQRSVPAGGLQRLATLGATPPLQSRTAVRRMPGWSRRCHRELVLDGTRRLHRQSQWYVFSRLWERQRTAMLATSLDRQSTEGETPWTDTSAAPPPPPDAPQKTGP
jgi:hypothetical protein